MTEVPLLNSKLEVPGPPPGLVERPRLGRVLDTGVRRPLTLVNAPPGWGKSVLLSWWARMTAFRVGWLGIEDGDDPRFWSYLRAALKTAGGSAADALPSPDEEAPHEVFLARLAAVLAEAADPVVVVLDDFHRIHDPRILKELVYLARHAGRTLRLIIVTRGGPGPPLARPRLAGAVTTVDAAELSFTMAETTELLAALGMDLPDRYTRTLLRRTEGWPAGLRMAGLSMREHSDPLRFVDELTGDHEPIAGYFASEVLDGLDGGHREVLLCGSVLDELTGGLADALTGRSDGERILADLRDAGAFLGPADDRRSGYRYHPLLGEFLRRELARRPPRPVADLHRRAAAWYSARGSAPDVLRHALLSLDWRMAKDLLADHWPDLVLSESDPPLCAPDPAPPEAALRDDPDLALACAVHQWMLGDRRGTDHYLRLADGRSADPGDGADDVKAAAIRLTRSVRAGDVASTFFHASRLLARRSDDEGARCVALCAVGTARLATGDLRAAERALDDGSAAAEREGRDRARAVCLSRLAVARALLGDLHLAARTARDSLGSAAAPAARGYAYLALAITHHEWGEGKEAACYLDLAEQSGDRLLGALTSTVRLWSLRAGEDGGEAFEALREARRALTGWPVPAYLAHRFTAAEAALRTSLGDTGTAARLLAGRSGARDAPGPLAVALARVQLTAGDADAAMATAGGASNGELGPSLEAGLLEALAADRLGRDRHASAVLERTLRLADHERFRGVFLREGRAARRLLTAHLDSGTACWPFVMEIVGCAAEREDGPAGPAAPLTGRELTVLRYLHSPLTTEEIAAELHLSVNTVKTHTRHIYRKLTASRRREAVRKAREARLL